MNENKKENHWFLRGTRGFFVLLVLFIVYLYTLNAIGRRCHVSDWGGGMNPECGILTSFLSLEPLIAGILFIVYNLFFSLIIISTAFVLGVLFTKNRIYVKIILLTFFIFLSIYTIYPKTMIQGSSIEGDCILKMCRCRGLSFFDHGTPGKDICVGVIYGCGEYDVCTQKNVE